MGKKVKYELLPKSKDPSYRRMHGNYPAKKYSKGAPAQVRLCYELAADDSVKFIDIAQSLSIINRRLYRQGCYYYINSVEFYNNEDKYLDVLTIPDTWGFKSAYRRALGIYNEMQEKALRNVNLMSVIGKYHDFKVYMSDAHRSTGNTKPSLYGINAVTPPAHTANVFNASDWDYSQFVSANEAATTADHFYAHVLGPTNPSASSNALISLGIIDSYMQTRPEPQVDNPALNANIDDDPLLRLNDASSKDQVEAIMNLAESENDEPPYELTNMVGQEADSMQHSARLLTTITGGRKDMASGFCAPLGLLCLMPETGTATASRIVLNLAVGTYSGTYAERIA